MEHGEAELVQQVVGGLEPADDAELLVEDPPHVLAAEGADAVVGRGPGAEAGLERSEIPTLEPCRDDHYASNRVGNSLRELPMESGYSFRRPT